MRSRATILTDIWNDEEFTSRTANAQRMYLFLLSQPKLSIVGTLDVNLERWAKKAAGLTPADVEYALEELAEHRFVIIDRVEGELVVRTIVKHDPARSYKAAIGMWNAWRSIASRELRKAVVNEMPDEMWRFEKAPAPTEAIQLRDTPIPADADRGIGAFGDTGTDSNPPDEGSFVLLPSSFSLPPPSPEPSDNGHLITEPGEGRVREVIEAVRKIAFDRAHPRSPELKAKIRAEAEAMRPLVVDALVMFPEAPAGLLAAYLQDEDVPNLGMYRAKEPA